MKKTKFIWTALLTILPALCNGEIRTDTGDKYHNLFIGQYGEAIYFDKELSVDARSADGMEIVNFYRALTIRNNRFVRFNPSTSRITPQTFADHDLIQMIVAPKIASQFASLHDLSDAKAAELTKQGAVYKIDRAFWPSDRFPDGSFEVEIDKPYRLVQLYTESTGYRYIVTCRRDADKESMFSKECDYIHEMLSLFLKKTQVRAIAPGGTDASRDGGRRYVQNERQLWHRDIIRFETGLAIAALIFYAIPITRILGLAVAGAVFSSASAALIGGGIGSVWVGWESLSAHWFGPAAISSVLCGGASVGLFGRLASRASRPWARTALWIYTITMLGAGFFLRERTPQAFLELIPLYSRLMAAFFALPFGVSWAFMKRVEMQS